jgi:hypothetical protein
MSIIEELRDFFSKLFARKVVKQQPTVEATSKYSLFPLRGYY